MVQKRAEPAFRRLWGDLRAQILENEFPPGVRLPTENDLAQQYSVSRQTVRRAFHDLVAEGLVYRVPGRGTFARPHVGRYLHYVGSVEDVMGFSVDSQFNVLDPLHMDVDPYAAGKLHLPVPSLGRVSFLRTHLGEPFQHSTAYLPPRILARLGPAPELYVKGAIGSSTLIGLVEAALDGPVRDAEQDITAATASAEVYDSLDLDHGTTLLRIERTYFDSHDEPIEFAINYFHPDRYSYRMRLRRNPR